MVDIDDTIIEVHGYTKQGSGYGYSGVRDATASHALVSNPSVPQRRLSLTGSGFRAREHGRD